MRPGGVARFLKPNGAASERLRLNELRIIMIPGLFLPDVDRAFADARSDEVEIANHELKDGRPDVLVQVGLGVAPMNKRENFKRRPVILGTRPTGKIERAVRIDAGLGQYRIAKDRLDFLVRPHILQEGQLSLLP